MGILRDVYELAQTVRRIRKDGNGNTLTIADASGILALHDLLAEKDEYIRLAEETVRALCDGKGPCLNCESFVSGTCKKAQAGCKFFRLRMLTPQEKARIVDSRRTGYPDGNLAQYRETENVGASGKLKPPVIYDPERG